MGGRGGVCVGGGEGAEVFLWGGGGGRAEVCVCLCGRRERGFKWMSVTDRPLKRKRMDRGAIASSP